MSAVRRVVRRVRAAVRRRSPLERAVPLSSMSALTRRARTEIRAFQVRGVVPVLRRPGYGRVTPTPGCAVYVHADTLAIDVVTLDYVWRRDLFPVDVRGRVVLDIGSHKGYYGALVLTEGAAAVVSFEPESVNFGALERATVDGRAPDWARHRAAVGATAGEVTLSVSTESWSHSIHAPASGDVVRTERVPMVPFGDVLADAFANHPGRPVVLKLNVEGAAGDCLLSVPTATLARLEVLLVDLEANTPQPLPDILGHLDAAGFELAGERELVYHFVRKDGR